MYVWPILNRKFKFVGDRKAELKVKTHECYVHATLLFFLCSTVCMKVLGTSYAQLSGYTRCMSVYIIIHTYIIMYLIPCSFNISVLCILHTASLQELWWNILLWLFRQQSAVTQLSKASQSV